jgi:Fur family transcriptional regulator, ferric uptake regulator
MAEEENVFVDYLKSRNLKMTGERQIILEEIFDRHDHFDADQLIRDIHDKGHAVSRATVYRTLDLLLGAELIQEIDFGAGRRLFEHTYGHDHHDHMMCVECGHIVEFVNQDIEQLQEMEAKRHGFDLVSHRMEMKVVCTDPKTCEYMSKRKEAS